MTKRAQCPGFDLCHPAFALVMCVKELRKGLENKKLDLWILQSRFADLTLEEP